MVTVSCDDFFPRQRTPEVNKVAIWTSSAGRIKKHNGPDVARGP